MNLAAIAFRVVVAYVFLLIIVRISGKRSIFQGTPLDFVVALILGDMIDDLVWSEVPAAQFVVATGIVVATHVLVSVGAFASPAFARCVQGVPLPVVRDGALLPMEMAKERLTEADVMADVRGSQLDDLREIRTATVEYSGAISSCKRRWAREAQKQDLERVREVVQ